MQLSYACDRFAAPLIFLSCKTNFYILITLVFIWSWFKSYIYIFCIYCIRVYFRLPITFRMSGTLIPMDCTERPPSPARLAYTSEKHPRHTLDVWCCLFIWFNVSFSFRLFKFCGNTENYVMLCWLLPKGKYMPTGLFCRHALRTFTQCLQVRWNCFYII